MRFLADLILLFIIAVCIWSGRKKGLAMCIVSILAIIISLYAGDLLASTFSPAVTPAVRPFVSGYMDGTGGVINKTVLYLQNGNSDLSLEDFVNKSPDVKAQLCEKSFEKVGIYSSTAIKMADDAVSYADNNGKTLPAAIETVMTNSITYFLSFLVFFSLTLIILTVLGNVLNLSFKFPEMDKLNDIGGIAAGAVLGFMFCAIIAWALKFTGAFIPEADMNRTLLTALFLKINILSQFLML